jgi:uridine phosphorylase
MQEVQVVADPEQVRHGDVHIVQVDPVVVPEAKYPVAHEVHVDPVVVLIVAHGMHWPSVAVTVEGMYPTLQMLHTVALAV